MDKASSALRRSSVKLMSIGSGHGGLQMIISQLRDVKAASRTFAAAQEAAIQDMVKWAMRDENRAIQDSVCQIAELFKIWSEVQREFGESFKDLRKHFEMIVEGERRLETARTALDASDAKLVKTRKEMKRAAKAKVSDADLKEIEKRLEALEKDRDKLQIDVFDSVRENEIVKMIRIKDGMLKTTQSYVDMVRKGDVLFGAGKFIAQQIPDVGEREIHEIKYTGSGTTMQAVIGAKERISHYSRDDDSYSYTFNTGNVAGGADRNIRADTAAAATSPGDAASPLPAGLPPPYSLDPPTNPFFNDDDDDEDNCNGNNSDASFVASPNMNVVAGVPPPGAGLYPRLSGSFHTPPSRPPPPNASGDGGHARRHSEAANLQSRRRSSSAHGLQNQSRGGMSASLVEDLGSGFGGLHMS